MPAKFALIAMSNQFGIFIITISRRVCWLTSHLPISVDEIDEQQQQLIAIYTSLSGVVTWWQEEGGGNGLSPKF